MALFALLVRCLSPHQLSSTSCRFVRARWERPYLKDIYHRRMIAGADPLLSRATYPNWDYGAELYAFTHRIGAPELKLDVLMQLLTDKAFYTRADVTANASGTQPSNQYDEFNTGGHNEEFINSGAQFLSDAVSAILRFGMPFAPEELITVLASKLLDQQQLAKLAQSLGMNHLIRTAEYPPSDYSLCRAFNALLGATSYERAITLIQNVIIPQLCDIDIEEAFPLAEPYKIVRSVLSANGAKEIEPRILGSSGEISAEPLFIVGIYADRQLVGQSPGETLQIAIDMASMVTLLRLWGVTSDKKFPFAHLDENFDLEAFRRPNFSLFDIMDEGFSLKFDDENMEPLDIKSVVLKYKSHVEEIVGRPLRRRLRHKFSRGSWGKRYFRYVMKPRVYTIC